MQGALCAPFSGGESIKPSRIGAHIHLSGDVCALSVDMTQYAVEQTINNASPICGGDYLTLVPSTTQGLVFRILKAGPELMTKSPSKANALRALALTPGAGGTAINHNRSPMWALPGARFEAVGGPDRRQVSREGSMTPIRRAPGQRGA